MLSWPVALRDNSLCSVGLLYEHSTRRPTVYSPALSPAKDKARHTIVKRPQRKITQDVGHNVRNISFSSRSKYILSFSCPSVFLSNFCLSLFVSRPAPTVCRSQIKTRISFPCVANCTKLYYLKVFAGCLEKIIRC